MIKQTLTAALVALSLGTAFAATTSSAFAWDRDSEHDRPAYSHNDDSYGNQYGYRRRGYDDGDQYGNRHQYGNRRRGYDGYNNNDGYNNGY